MRLNNLTADLDKINAGQPPVLEQVLHAMIALCTDIQIHCGGNKIKKGSVVDYRSLNNHLTYLSKLLCEIHSTHEAEIAKRTGNDFKKELLTVREKTVEAQKKMLEHEDRAADLARAEEELRAELERQKQSLEALRSQEEQNSALSVTLEQTISRIKSIDLSALAQKISALQAEKAKLEAEKAASEQTAAGLQRDIDDNRQKCCSSDSECVRLTGELEQCKATLAKSEARRQELEGQFDDITGEEAAANARATELTGLIAKAGEQLIALRQRIEKDEAVLAGNEADIAEQQGIYDELAPKVSSSTGELKELLDQVAAARGTLAGNDNAIQAARLELQQKTAAIARQNADLKTLQGEIAQADLDIADLDQKIQTARDTLTSRTAEVARKQQEYDHLTGQIQTLEAQLADLNARCENAAGQIADLTQKLAVARHQLQSLGDRKDGLEKELEESQNLTTALTGEIAALNAALAAALARNKELEAQRSAAEAALSKARTEAEQLGQQAKAALADEAEYIRLINDRKLTLERLAGIRSEIEIAKEDLSTAESEKAAAESTHNGLRTEIAGVTAAARELVRQSEELKTQLSTAEAERDGCKNACDTLRGSLEGAKKESEALKTQSGKLQTELDGVNAHIPVQTAAVKDLNNRIDEAKKERETLMNQAYALQTELGYQNTRNENYRTGDLKTAEDDLAAANTLMEEMKARFAALKKEQERLETDRNNADQEIERVSFDIRLKQDGLARSTAELEEKKREHSGLEEQLKQIRMQIAEIVKDLKPLLDQIAEEKIVLERYDPVALRAKFESEQAELRRRIKEVETMRDQLTVFASELNEKRTERDNLENDKKHAEEEFRILAGELALLKEPNAQARVARYNSGIESLKKIRDQIVGAAESLRISTAVPVDTLLGWELDSIGATIEGLRTSIVSYTDTLKETISPNN